MPFCFLLYFFNLSFAFDDASSLTLCLQFSFFRFLCEHFLVKSYIFVSFKNPKRVSIVTEKAESKEEFDDTVTDFFNPQSYPPNIVSTRYSIHVTDVGGIFIKVRKRFGIIRWCPKFRNTRIA